MKDVFDPSFAAYGMVIEGYDTKELLEVLVGETQRPKDSVVYVPSEPMLEKLPIMERFSDCAYGGMPIQIGYCNGSNNTLNCLEYHRGSELNIPAEDMVLLLSDSRKMDHGKIDTSEVEAFLAPAGAVVLLYETTLHYAPCNANGNDGFRVIVVLPRGTNTEKPDIEIQNYEDRMLFARNKWLSAHPDSAEAKSGAFVGISGENLVV